jgi:endonuclease G
MMKKLLILLLVPLIIACNQLFSPSGEMKPIRAPKIGTCECPYDQRRDGRECGSSSAYDRGSGDRPVCYIGEDKQVSSSKKHLLMGNPSNATANPINLSNYLMEKPEYALSYNANLGTANWVSWQLNQSWLGSSDRQNNFSPDSNLPKNFYQVTAKDYTNTGYDRGHIIPSSDRTRTLEENSATFLMVNMLPQAPDLNREVWRELELESRRLVDQGKELYIVAGPHGKIKTIANGQVTVTKYNWKVILILDRPGSNPKSVTAQTKAIAVWMPNNDSVKRTSWKNYIVTVDDVEAKTGYDFFSNLPPTVQKVIESQRYIP